MKFLKAYIIKVLTILLNKLINLTIPIRLVTCTCETDSTIQNLVVSIVPSLFFTCTFLSPPSRSCFTSVLCASSMLSTCVWCSAFSAWIFSSIPCCACCRCSCRIVQTLQHWNTVPHQTLVHVISSNVQAKVAIAKTTLHHTVVPTISNIIMVT